MTELEWQLRELDAIAAEEDILRWEEDENILEEIEGEDEIE